MYAHGWIMYLFLILLLGFNSEVPCRASHLCMLYNFEYYYWSNNTLNRSHINEDIDFGLEFIECVFYSPNVIAITFSSGSLDSYNNVILKWLPHCMINYYYNN